MSFHFYIISPVSCGVNTYFTETSRYEIRYEYVRTRIRHRSRFAQRDKKGLLDRLPQSGDREKAAAMKKKIAELSKAERRRDEVDKLFARMYEDRVSGDSTEQNFTMLSQKYQSEQAEPAEKSEKIIVHKAEKDEIGTRTQDVDIYCLLVGKIA